MWVLCYHYVPMNGEWYVKRSMTWQNKIQNALNITTFHFFRFGALISLNKLVDYNVSGLHQCSFNKNFSVVGGIHLYLLAFSNNTFSANLRTISLNGKLSSSTSPVLATLVLYLLDHAFKSRFPEQDRMLISTARAQAWRILWDHTWSSCSQFQFMRV